VNCSCGSATTDTNGSYTLGNIDAGSYTVTASASGYLSQQKNATVSAGNDTTLAFALVKTATYIGGQVTDAASGLAISGATVSFSLGSTTTNATGAYQLDNVPPGTYTLTASASGYSSVNQNVVVTAGTPATANFALPVLPPPPPPPPPTRIKDITLEDGSLTNPSSGADAVQGSVSLNSATPLKQVYSANVTAGSSFVDESFTAASDFYLSFYFRLNAIPTSDVRLVQITNAGTTTVKVQVKTTGRLRLVAGSTTIGETSNSLTVGQVYRLGIHQKAGTGANAVAEAFLAVGDQEFGTPFATSANGTWKTSADRVRVGATTSTPVNVVLDDLRLDSGSMPPPSGTPPPPGAAPSADFKATPASGVAPLTVQFQDLSTGNPTSWAWDFQNDGQVDSTSQNPQFTYTASGTYTVKMTTSNAQGSSSATKTALITVQNAAPVSTLTFAPVADAHVKSTSASSNYGTNTSLQIRQGDASNNTTYRAYLKFTVSGLTGPVTSAKLRLYVSDASAQLTTVSATTTSWTETGLTWNNAPAPGAFLASGGPPKLGWLGIPLPTSAFGLGNGTYALVLTDGGTDSAIFNSREGANPPQLVLSQ
jgi:PKD repeat protein